MLGAVLKQGEVVVDDVGIVDGGCAGIIGSDMAVARGVLGLAWVVASNSGHQYLQGGAKALPMVQHPALLFLQPAVYLSFLVHELACHFLFFLPFLSDFSPTVFVLLFLCFFPTFIAVAQQCNGIAMNW